MTTCLNCGEEFEPTPRHPHQKYCNPGCRIAAWLASHRKERKIYDNKYQKNYRVANREKVLAREHKYCVTHREIRNSYNREYRVICPAKGRIATRKWKDSHPEEVRISVRARRARKAGAEGCFTANEWLDLCERTGNRCVCCGSTGKLSADHIVPLIKGGSNNIDNIQPLCKPCNSKKHTTVIDYRPWVDWT